MKEVRVIDYRGPDMAGATSPPGTGSAMAVVAFVAATVVTGLLMFGVAHWVRFARAGSRLYGPQDQYVDLGHQVGATISLIGMSVIGGTLFALTVVQLLRRRRATLDGGGWIAAGVLGVAYVLVFSATVWTAEQLAGPEIGGPTGGEFAAHVIIGAAYPVLAAWLLAHLKGEEESRFASHSGGA